MHMSGPSRKKDENIFSDVYFIPLTVVLVHSTAYVQAHILNFLVCNFYKYKHITWP